MLENGPEGVIVGGWSYVIAAYSITAAGLILYTLSLLRRIRNQRQPRRREGVS